MECFKLLKQNVFEKKNICLATSLENRDFTKILHFLLSSAIAEVLENIMTADMGSVSN